MRGSNSLRICILCKNKYILTIMSYNVTLNMWLQAGNVNKYDVLPRFLCAAKQEHNQRHMNYKIDAKIN